MAKKGELTNKQESFCQDIGTAKYDFDWLAYEANYSTKGWSKNAIYVETCRLLQNPKISLRIKEIREGIVKRNHVTVDEVLNELANWIRFDPLDIVDEETDALKSLKDMDKKARMSLAEIHVQETFSTVEGHRVKTGELKKVKFIDKRATAESFMKKFGQYVNEQNDTTNNLELIREIIASAKK